MELELGPELVGEEKNIFPRMVRKVAPRHACGALEAFPYFKAKDLTAYKDSMVPKQEVNKFKFMVELSRFINGKAPALLQVRITLQIFKGLFTMKMIDLFNGPVHLIKLSIHSISIGFALLKLQLLLL